MLEYAGKSQGVMGYINSRPREPNGSLPNAFLDGLIKSSLEELERNG